MERIALLFLNGAPSSPAARQAKGKDQRKRNAHTVLNCSGGKKNFQEHIIVKHEKSATHKCDQCSQSFGYLSKLHDHQKQVHQRVKCEDCGKDVCNAFMLKRHRATVHGIKPIDSHQCNQCPMFFTIRSSLDKHIAAKHPSF